MTVPPGDDVTNAAEDVAAATIAHAANLPKIFMVAPPRVSIGSRTEIGKAQRY
jgi:hypothetical protein